MLGTVLAPELVLAKAMDNLCGSRKMTKSMRAFAREDNVQWTTTHSLYADMGGFAISYGGADLEKSVTLQIAMMFPAAERHEPVGISGTGETPGSNSRTILGDYAQKAWEIKWWRENTEVVQSFMDGRVTQYNLIHLSAVEILRLRAANKIRLPPITEDDINDKSKSDTFAKAIAVGQILWNTVQIIARAIQRLPVSQLELAILAFSACAVIIYVLNWKKPKGPQIPHIVRRYNGVVPDAVLSCLRIKLNEAIVWEPDPIDVIKKRLSSSPIPNDNGAIGDDWSRFVGFVGASTVFGALHVVAWNFAFPTRIEQIIWRATSIYITSAVPLMSISFLLTHSTSFYVLFPALYDWIELLLVVSYIPARLFLLVEIFRTMFFLPPETFISTWSANIPHLS